MTRIVGTWVLVTVAVCAAYWIGALGILGLDRWIERYCLVAAAHQITIPMSAEIVAIHVDATNGDLGAFESTTAGEGWRQHYAELLDKLAGAGARAVVFDMYFRPPQDKNVVAHSAFVSAINRFCAQQGRPVIIGYRSGDPRDRDLNASCAIVASVYTGGEEKVLGDEKLDRMVLAQFDERRTNGGVLTRALDPVSLPLAIRLATGFTALSAIQLSLNESRERVLFMLNGASNGEIRVTLLPCAGTDCVPAAGFDARVNASVPLFLAEVKKLHDVPIAGVLGRQDLGQEFQGKIVIVGARVPEEEFTKELPAISQQSQVYGYQIVASVAADLLNDTYPRSASDLLHGLSIAVLAALGIVVRRYVPWGRLKTKLLGFDFEIPVILLVGILFLYLPLLIVVFKEEHIVFAIGYPLAAVIAAYYLSQDREASASPAATSAGMSGAPTASAPATISTPSTVVVGQAPVPVSGGTPITSVPPVIPVPPQTPPASSLPTAPVSPAAGTTGSLPNAPGP